MNSAFQWLALHNVKKRARSVSVPVIQTMEAEIESCREAALLTQVPYLRKEIDAAIKDLRLTLQLIKDSSSTNVVAALGIQRLDKMVDRGLKEAEKTEGLRRGHEKLRERIKQADSELNAMYLAAPGTSLAVAKRHRDAIAGIRRLRADLAHEKHQREFHRTLQDLEAEIQQHRGWLAGMESSAAAIAVTRAAFELLRSSAAWTTTKGADESVQRAEMNLNFAATAWENSNWRRANQLLIEAQRHIEAARDACDRALYQARDEIGMWRQFLRNARSYLDMQEMMKSFPAELPAIELQRWVDYRHENERQIAVEASQAAQLSAKLPFRTVPALHWKESSLDAHRIFALAVSKSCKETVSLLRKRHRKRRPVKARDH
jgi:hypothetical protein